MLFNIYITVAKEIPKSAVTIPATPKAGTAPNAALDPVAAAPVDVAVALTVALLHVMLDEIVKFFDKVKSAHFVSKGLNLSKPERAKSLLT